MLYLEQRSEKLTVEDMKELRYLECVIKVGHRLQPHDHIAAILLLQFSFRTTQGPPETCEGSDYLNGLGKTSEPRNEQNLQFKLRNSVLDNLQVFYSKSFHVDAAVPI